MSYTNAPIHDLLIRIKNAYMSRIPVTENIIASSLKIKVLDLLVTYKFIASYDVRQD
jgi:ribosomal protein S8